MMEDSEYLETLDHSRLNLSRTHNDSSFKKFVVNAYDSRLSKRSRRNPIFKSSEQLKWVLNKSVVAPSPRYQDQNNNRDNSVSKISKIDADMAMEMFFKLKDERDVECVKIAQASKLIEFFNKQRGNWRKILTAQKVLLESGEKFRLIMEKIRADNYQKDFCESSETTGSITLSNIQFPLSHQKPKKSDEHFVILLSYETEVKTSKIITPKKFDNCVKFDEVFTFKVKPDFSIKAQIYSVTKSRIQSNNFSFLLPLRKKTKSFCTTTFKIFYKNVHTSEMEARDVLKSSFELKGEFTIQRENIQSESNVYILQNTTPNSILIGQAQLVAEIKNFEASLKKSGFLTFGQISHGWISWNRRWCLLDGAQLKIYNSPNDEDLVDPILIINLVSVGARGEITEIDSSMCGRSRTFLIESESGGALKQYYFRADNRFDLRNWIDMLNFAIKTYKEWNSSLFNGNESWV